MILRPDNNTDLRIFWLKDDASTQEIILPEPATRQLHHSLVLIPEAFRGDDDPNGNWIDATRAGFIKFDYTVEFADIWLPVFAGFLVGKKLRIHVPVDAIEQIWAPQQRPEVPGSVEFMNADMEIVDQATAVFRVYYPVLDCIFRAMGDAKSDEWGATSSASMTFREISAT